MKRLQTAGLIVGVMLVCACVAVGVSGVARDYLAADQPRCITREVFISNGRVDPSHVTGRLCDTLQIVNRDSVIRELAFGPHYHHLTYDGITEEVVGPGQGIVITMNKIGTYHFHDHLHEDIIGDFTVSN